MPRVDPIDVGDVVIVTFEIRDRDGLLRNPTTLACTFERPAGTEVIVAATEAQVGIWEAEITADAAGVWKYRGVAAGASVGVDQGSFRVREPNV